MKHKPARQQKKVAKGYSSPEPDVQDSSGSEGKSTYFRLLIIESEFLKGYYCTVIYENGFSYIIFFIFFKKIYKF